MKTFLIWIFCLPLSASATPLECLVHSNSVSDGGKISHLVDSGNGVLMLDLYLHHFEVKPDSSGTNFSYQIKEMGGMPRASGLSPLPSVGTAFILTYMDRSDKTQFTLKCR